MLRFLTCVFPYRPNVFKRNKKKKGPETADAATSTDDFYMYGSMYEINENRAMRTSIPSTCWTEMSNVDFTDDEALDHASTASLCRTQGSAETKRSCAGADECEIVELSRSMSASALEDTSSVPETPTRKISRHASNNF